MDNIVELWNLKVELLDKNDAYKKQCERIIIDIDNKKCDLKPEQAEQIGMLLIRFAGEVNKK